MVIIYLQRQRMKMKRAKRKKERKKNGKMNMTVGKKVHVLAHLHPTRPWCCSITTTTTRTTTAESTSIKKKKMKILQSLVCAERERDQWLMPYVGDSVICCCALLSTYTRSIYIYVKYGYVGKKAYRGTTHVL